MEKKSSLHDFRYTVPLLTVLVFFIFRFQQTKCLLIDIYFIQVWATGPRVYIPVLGSVRESWCGPMTVMRLGLNRLVWWWVTNLRQAKLLVNIHSENCLQLGYWPNEKISSQPARAGNGMGSDKF